MSSNISTMVLNSIPPKTISELKMEEKKYRLVRTASIEKIRRFNTFICSQQYYILPAILHWIKSSHSGLQLSTEKTIFFFRSLFFSSFLYKFFMLLQPNNELRRVFLGDVKKSTSEIISNFHKKFSKCFESTFLLAATIYVGCILIAIQLCIVLYFIYFTFIPYGFVFLVACMLTIKYICYKTLFYSLTKKPESKIKYKWSIWGNWSVFFSLMLSGYVTGNIPRLIV